METTNTTPTPTLADLVAMRLADANASNRRARQRIADNLGQDMTDVRRIASTLEDAANAEGQAAVLRTLEYFIGHPIADLRAYLVDQLMRSADDRWSGYGTRNALERAYHDGTLTSLRWAMEVTK